VSRKSRRKAAGVATPVTPTVTLDDIAAWGQEGALASVFVTPVPAPRSVNVAVATAERLEADGQFGYRAGVREQPLARFTFEDGRFVDIFGNGLIGRNPTPEGYTGIEHLIRLDDPLRELSRLHLSFGIDGPGLWIADQHSTNGVLITRRGAGTIKCEPGARTPIQSGDIVTFAGHAMSITEIARQDTVPPAGATAPPATAVHAG
jgi:hypothetical protein